MGSLVLVITSVIICLYMANVHTKNGLNAPKFCQLTLTMDINKILDHPYFWHILHLLPLFAIQGDCRKGEYIKYAQTSQISFLSFIEIESEISWSPSFLLIKPPNHKLPQITP